MCGGECCTIGQSYKTIYAGGGANTVNEQTKRIGDIRARVGPEATLRIVAVTRDGIMEGPECLWFFVYTSSCTTILMLRLRVRLGFVPRIDHKSKSLFSRENTRVTKYPKIILRIEQFDNNNRRIAI